MELTRETVHTLIHSAKAGNKDARQALDRWTDYIVTFHLHRSEPECAPRSDASPSQLHPQSPFTPLKRRWIQRQKPEAK
jgi:hypothetical protein